MVKMEHAHLAKTPETERRYEKRNSIQIKKSLVLILLTVNLVCVQCSEFDKVVSKIEELRDVGRSIVKDVYYNGTFRTGNVLWDNILNQCTITPSMSCLQKNVYSYLDDNLGFNGDIRVSDDVCFRKNNVDIDKYSKEANIIYLTGSKNEAKKEFEGRSVDDSENNIEDDDEVSESPIEEVTDALYNKGVKFLVSHDTQIRLPEFFFHGATLKISPRALTKTGALIHIDLQPKEEVEGRLFFHKIKKLIRKKLLLAALAVILVIKLIALKLFFVFPIIFGVTTAKKLFMKLLLFLFPALSHIFKLCSWYHQNYHTTKFHHHHHLVTHHHHKPPHGHGPPVYGPPHHSPHSTVITSPHQDGPPAFEHYPQDWELSGPGLGNEYIATDIHRNAINNFKPNLNDADDINAWGLGLPPGTAGNIGEIAASPSVNQPAVVGPPGPGSNRITMNNGRPVGPPLNPYHRNKKLTHKDPQQAEKEALIRAAALAASAPPSPVRDELLRVSAAKLHEANRVRAESELVKQQQHILAAQDPDTIAAEKFYGSLIERVDSILGQLGANEPGCLERAVCSLYKDPFRHTPYSNLVSNELSKDSNELLPAADSKMALRYYKYVQAARDGQEQKDCINIYPQCNIDYSK